MAIPQARRFTAHLSSKVAEAGIGLRACHAARGEGSRPPQRAIYTLDTTCRRDYPRRPCLPHRKRPQLVRFIGLS